MGNVEIRLLTLADVPLALALSTAARWNQTPADWRTVIELEPEGCLGLEEDGKLVATTTLLRYGTRLAWVGMVLTDANYQRRGFARALVSRSLELADAWGVETVKLDATDQGIGLYLSLGFESEQSIERWSRAGAGSGAPVPREPAADFSLVKELDREAFFVNRSRLLRSMIAREDCFTAQDGYLVCRPGARATYLGPCVARTPAAAGALLTRAMSKGDGPFFWDLFPEHPHAAALAASFGFHADRKLTRMSRGKHLAECGDGVYAIAGFEFG